jgi:cardiolipin hydrolase
LHETGIAVRIITNEEHEALSGSQIERFQREGIQVRHDKTSFYMHHKFVVVDGSVLITGSFNWTRQAVTGNRENVLVTNNLEIVGPYVEEYEKLWELYKPVKSK